MDTASERASTPDADGDPPWTARQKEVLDLIARGKTNQEVADTLGISLDGAKWHMREILSKLGVDTREEAAEHWRRRNGWAATTMRAVRGRLTSSLGMWVVASAWGAGLVFLGILAWAQLRADQDAPVIPYTIQPYVAEPAPHDLKIMIGIADVVLVGMVRSEQELEVVAVYKNRTDASPEDLLAILGYDDSTGERPEIGDRILLLARADNEAVDVPGVGRGLPIGPVGGLESQLRVVGDQAFPFVDGESPVAVLSDLRAAARGSRDPALISKALLQEHGWRIDGPAQVDYGPRFSHHQPTDAEVLRASLAAGLDYRPYEGRNVFLVYFFEGVLEPGEDLRAVLLVDGETIVGGWVEGTDGNSRQAFSVEDRADAIAFARTLD